jgi:CelD/BcsL family acetyltransferase involved in cellulose biosynthesis
LVDRSRLPSPFLKSWWVDNAASGEPAILTCHSEDGLLVGGAAFEVDEVRLGPLEVARVRALGQGQLAPDHIDVLAAPGHRADVLTAVCRWLRAGNRIVDLDGLSGNCEIPWLLNAPLLNSQGAPYLTLASTDPVAELPGRLRSTIKRTSKRLARSGFEPRVVPPAEAERGLETLLRLHDHRWQERSSWGASEATLRRTLLAGLRCGGAVIHEITDGEKVIASEIELLAGTRVAFYQAGRLTDKEFRGSGSALKAEVLRWAVRKGMTEFDLLRGDDSYKADWSDARREVRRARTGYGLLGLPASRVMNTWQDLAPSVQQLASRFRSGAS